jgi:hypothetical protein
MRVSSGRLEGLTGCIAAPPPSDPTKARTRQWRLLIQQSTAQLAGQDRVGSSMDRHIVLGTRATVASPLIHPNGC